MSTAKEDFSHCLVAESDYQAAASAITATFESSFQDQQEDSLAINFLHDTRSSLLKHMEQILQNVGDEEFHAAVDPYHVIPHEEEEDDSGDDYESEEEEEETSKPEIDEEDLLDMKAYETAQKKRNQVRLLSKRVQEIRQRVLERVSLEACKDFSVQQSKGLRLESFIEEETTISLTDLQTSLQNLTSALERHDNANNPTQQRRLQDTIETIQKDQNSNTLSQTEAAIVSRTNSWTDEELKEEFQLLSQPDSFTGNTAATATVTGLSPEDRLALFLNDYS
jgi:hypothetical protein